MTLVFLANAYRLASLLCVLLIGSAVAAICLYGLAVPSFSEIYLQIMPIGYAIWTLVDIHRLLPYIHRTDTTVSSRVNKHYISLVVHPFVYFEYALSTYVLESHAMCRAHSFILWKCIPVALNGLLPLALVVTLLTASEVLRRRARAIHGSALVPMPEPVPLPSGYKDSVVRAWRTAHLAELEMPASVEEGGDPEAAVVKSEKALGLV